MNKMFYQYRFIFIKFLKIFISNQKFILNLIIFNHIHYSLNINLLIY